MPRTRAQSIAAAQAEAIESEPSSALSTPRKRQRRTAAPSDERASPHFALPSPPATPRTRSRTRATALGTSSADDRSASPYFPPSPPATPTRASTSSPTKRKRKRAADGVSDEPKLPTREMLPHDPAHFGLIQEVVCEDKSPLGTWKMLIATCLLNQTSGRQARPVLWQILERWPTPPHLAAADLAELTDVLYPIGLFNIRARRLIAFSAAFVAEPPDAAKLHRNKSDKEYDPTPVSHYPGVGRYALDSYRIFVGPEPDRWRTIMPLDKELKAYLIWRWAKEGLEWCPTRGVVGALPADFELPVR